MTLVEAIAAEVIAEGKMRCSGYVLVLDHNNLVEAIKRGIQRHEENKSDPTT